MSSKKKNFFSTYKMYLISAEGYKIAGARFLRVKSTGDIWASMKNVKDMSIRYKGKVWVLKTCLI